MKIEFPGWKFVLNQSHLQFRKQKELMIINLLVAQLLYILFLFMPYILALFNKPGPKPGYMATHLANGSRILTALIQTKP
jgi:hypothetical protein